MDHAAIEKRASSGRGAVIFDRDGVLNVDLGYAYRPDQITWIEGAIQAVRLVNGAGLYAFVATNQSGIGRGYYSEDNVIALHAWMAERLAEQGAHIDAFAYCPHHPESEDDRYRAVCRRRKPLPGMIDDLLAEFGVEPSRAAMIGDKDTDMQAAAAAKVEGVPFQGGSLLDAVRPIVERLRALMRAPSG